MFLTYPKQNERWITGVVLLNNNISGDNISEVGLFFSKSRNIGRIWKHFCELNHMNWISDYVKTFNGSDIWE